MTNTIRPHARALRSLRNRAKTLRARLRGSLFRLTTKPLVVCGPGLQLGRHVDFEIYGALRLGTDVFVSDGASISVRPGAVLEIGSRSFIGRHTVVVAAESVIIGDDVLIAEHCSVRDGDHQATAAERTVETRLRTSPIAIEDGVWIAAGARVLRGTTLGAGSIVGANSVVKGVVAPGHTVAGVPATVIRTP